jgi:hypothetical protein
MAICPFSRSFLELDEVSRRKLLATVRGYWGPSVIPLLDEIRHFIRLHDRVSLSFSRLQRCRDARARRTLDDQLYLFRIRAQHIREALRTWGESQPRARPVAADWLERLETLMAELTSRPGDRRSTQPRRPCTSAFLRACGTPRSTSEAARVLALTPPFNLARLKTRYWRRALRYHPDRGGDSQAMRAINSAYQRFRRKLLRS